MKLQFYLYIAENIKMYSYFDVLNIKEEEIGIKNVCLSVTFNR